MPETTNVECGNCGAIRPSELIATGVCTPCPECGSMKLKLVVSIVDRVPTPRDSISWDITPSDQSTGWERRWELINSKLHESSIVRNSQVSAKNIHEAASNLRGFYVRTYHLKDALKNEAAQTGVSRQGVENAITISPTLLLLADLANLDKHGQLTKVPRSGTKQAVQSWASQLGHWGLIQP